MKTLYRLLCWLFTLCMLLTVVPASTIAAGEDDVSGSLQTLTASTEANGIKYTGSPGGILFLDPATEVLTPECISVDETHFPDPGFRDYVAQNIDTNMTQWLTPGEIAAVTAIRCSNCGIASLTGIEYFTELTSLICNENPLTELDLGGNADLLHLYFSSCELTGLDLSHTPDLEHLVCPGNPGLASLSLSSTPKLLEAVLEGSRDDFTDEGYDAWFYRKEPYRVLVDKGLLLTYEMIAQPDYDCILPADVKTIGEGALAGCAFRAVRIPDGAVEIGERAFAGSPDLKYVYIPESVTTIAADAFDQVTGLTIIGTAGSMAETYARACGCLFSVG